MRRSDVHINNHILPYEAAAIHGTNPLRCVTSQWTKLLHITWQYICIM